MTFLQRHGVIEKEFQFQFMRKQNENETLFFECPAKCGNFLIDVDPTYVLRDSMVGFSFRCFVVLLFCCFVVLFPCNDGGVVLTCCLMFFFVLALHRFCRWPSKRNVARVGWGCACNATNWCRRTNFTPTDARWPKRAKHWTMPPPLRR